MRMFTRSIALVALIAGLVAGCGAGAASPATTPGAMPTAALAAATATPAPPKPAATPVATPTTAPSVGPMDPAHVTGFATGGAGSEGTTREEGGLTITEGVVLDGISVTLFDPRVSGLATMGLNEIKTPGGLAYQWGTLRIENAEGDWEGSWRGAGWGNPPSETGETDGSGWLTGSGAYEGLTLYLHFQGHAIQPADLLGVILPVPPPTVP